MFLFWIYNIFSYIGIIVVPLILKIRIYDKKEDETRSQERYGYASKNRPNGKLIWIHAVSIGEVNSILPLIKKMSSNGQNILITTSSLGSVNFLKGKLPQNVIHQMMPLDCPIYIKRFLLYWKPNKIIFVESEIWPNTFYYGSIVSEIYIINTFIPNKAYKSWIKYGKSLLSFLLNKTTKIFTTTEDMQKKLSSLVSEKKIVFLNHTKYDSAIESSNILPIIQPSDKFIVVFASTHDGEEKIALHTHLALKLKIPNLLTIIVPRHLNRMSNISKLLEGFKAVIYPNDNIEKDTEIILINQIGTLMSFYKIANVAIICGSLVPDIGGHNPLEPASLGKTIIIGKYNDSCSEICQELSQNQAILIAQNQQDLLNMITDISKNKYPENAQNALNFVKQKSGSSEFLANFFTVSS